MHINNNDLDFLVELESKLFYIKKWHNDAMKLYEINEKLIKQREEYAKKSYDRIKAKRKTNKNYARGNYGYKSND